MNRGTLGIAGAALLGVTLCASLAVPGGRGVETRRSDAAIETRVVVIDPASTAWKEACGPYNKADRGLDECYMLLPSSSAPEIPWDRQSCRFNGGTLALTCGSFLQTCTESPGAEHFAVQIRRLDRDARQPQNTYVPARELVDALPRGWKPNKDWVPPTTEPYILKNLLVSFGHCKNVSPEEAATSREYSPDPPLSDGSGNPYRDGHIVGGDDDDPNDVDLDDDDVDDDDTLFERDEPTVIERTTPAPVPACELLEEPPYLVSTPPPTPGGPVAGHRVSMKIDQQRVLSLDPNPPSCVRGACSDPARYRDPSPDIVVDRGVVTTEYTCSEAGGITPDAEQQITRFERATFDSLVVITRNIDRCNLTPADVLANVSDSEILVEAGRIRVVDVTDKGSGFRWTSGGRKGDTDNIGLDPSLCEDTQTIGGETVRPMTDVVVAYCGRADEAIPFKAAPENPCRSRLGDPLEVQLEDGQPSVAAASPEVQGLLRQLERPHRAIADLSTSGEPVTCSAEFPIPASEVRLVFPVKRDWIRQLDDRCRLTSIRAPDASRSSDKLVGPFLIEANGNLRAQETRRALDAYGLWSTDAEANQQMLLRALRSSIQRDGRFSVALTALRP